MDMFKALDIWMAELEEEFYEDYMRAHNALEDWKNAKRAMVRDVDVWDIRDSLKGNYRSYSCLTVTKRYREEVVTRDGVDWVFLIDTVTIDGNDYEVLVATAKAKGQEDVHVSWSVERHVEDTFKEKHSHDFGWELFLKNRKVYVADTKLVQGRDEAWIRATAHKDMIRHKEALEAKIMKICDKIDSVMDEFGEYYVKGTNGRTAHVWRIFASGPIQRLHTRVLCKEVKNNVKNS